MLPLPVGEGLVLADPLHFYRAGLAMAVLGNDALGHALILGIFVVVFIPVQEHDGVRVLLDGAGFPEVGQNRSLVGAALHRTGQLA